MSFFIVLLVWANSAALHFFYNSAPVVAHREVVKEHVGRTLPMDSLDCKKEWANLRFRSIRKYKHILPIARACRASASLCAAVLTTFLAGGILLWVMIDKRRLAAVRSAAGKVVGGL